MLETYEITWNQQIHKKPTKKNQLSFTNKFFMSIFLNIILNSLDKVRCITNEINSCTFIEPI